MKGPLVNAAAQVLWRVPGRFRLSALAQPRNALRCVLFHHIASEETDFTRGLGVTTSAELFEERLRFLRRWYTPIDLETVRSGLDREWELPPVLVTFDDAYRSVLTEAAPVCKAQGVPAVLFANGGLLGNRTLALDNLLAYVFNTHGLAPIEKASGSPLGSFKDVFQSLLPSMTLAERRAFATRVAEEAALDPARLAAQERLYLDPEDLPALTALGVEIGNHTATHTHLRSLTLDECEAEIAGNKTSLEQASRSEVYAFSYPYGARADATEQARAVVRDSGHSLAFLVHGLPNKRLEPESLYRVSLKATDDATSFFELEVLPALRALRHCIRG